MTEDNITGISFLVDELGIKVVNSSQTLIGSTGQGTCTSDVLHQAICDSTAVRDVRRRSAISAAEMCGESRVPLNNRFSATLTTRLYFLSKRSRNSRLSTASGSLNATSDDANGPGGGLYNVI